MHELYELKEMLMEELKKNSKKDQLTSGTLDVIDKLSHAVKNLCKIIETYEEEEYSMAADGSYRRGGNLNRGGNSYAGGSYARGRGRNARRNGMGRYSGEQGYSGAVEDMVQELRELMEDAPDERTKQEFQRFIQKMEQM